MSSSASASCAYARAAAPGSSSNSDSDIEEADESLRWTASTPPTDSTARHRSRRKRGYQETEESAFAAMERELAHESGFDDVDDFLAGAEAKEDRARKRQRESKSQKVQTPRLTSRFPVDNWDYDGERKAYINEHKGSLPYCPMCSERPASNDASSSTFVREIPARFEENFGTMELKTLCSLICCAFDEKVRPDIIQQHKQRRVEQRDRAKTQKENEGETWTQADESKYKWDVGQESEFSWLPFECAYHFRSFPSAKLVYTMTAWYAAQQMNTLAHHRLFETDPNGSNPGVSIKDSIAFRNSFATHQAAMKSLQAMAKTKS